MNDFINTALEIGYTIYVSTDSLNREINGVLLKKYSFGYRPHYMTEEETKKIESLEKIRTILYNKYSLHIHQSGQIVTGEIGRNVCSGPYGEEKSFETLIKREGYSYNEVLAQLEVGLEEQAKNSESKKIYVKVQE